MKLKIKVILNVDFKFFGDVINLVYFEICIYVIEIWLYEIVFKVFIIFILFIILILKSFWKLKGI